MISRITCSGALIAVLALVIVLVPLRIVGAGGIPADAEAAPPAPLAQGQAEPTQIVPPATESTVVEPVPAPQEDLLRAQPPDAPPLLDSPIWLAVGLVALMLVVIGAVIAIRRWLATR